MSLHNPKTTEVIEVHINNQIGEVWVWRTRKGSSQSSFFRDYRYSTRRVEVLLRRLSQVAYNIDTITVETHGS